MKLDLKDILRDCHRSMINSCSDSELFFSDAKFVCEDGTINYSKLLLTVADPVIVKILQENNHEDDDHQKIILCPDFKRKEIIKSWNATLFTSNSYFDATPNVNENNRSVQCEDEDSFLLVPSEESLVYFDDQSGVNRTTESESTSNEFLCTFCGGRFPNEEKLKKHFYNVHHASKNKFQCLDCKKLFSSKAILSKHKTSVHKEVVKKCPVCLKIFKTIAEFKLHEPRHKELECQVCGKTSSNKFNHDRHLLIHHGQPKTLSCELCEKRFSLKHQLDRHKLIHTKTMNQLILCPNCNRSFTRKEHMMRHQAKCKG